MDAPAGMDSPEGSPCRTGQSKADAVTSVSIVDREHGCFTVQLGNAVVGILKERAKVWNDRDCIRPTENHRNTSLFGWEKPSESTEPNVLSHAPSTSTLLLNPSRDGDCTPALCQGCSNLSMKKLLTIEPDPAPSTALDCFLFSHLCFPERQVWPHLAALSCPLILLFSRLNLPQLPQPLHLRPFPSSIPTSGQSTKVTHTSHVQCTALLCRRALWNSHPHDFTAWAPSPWASKPTLGVQGRASTDGQAEPCSQALPLPSQPLTFLQSSPRHLTHPTPCLRKTTYPVMCSAMWSSCGSLP